jgi:hypothetical protein
MHVHASCYFDAVRIAIALILIQNLVAEMQIALIGCKVATAEKRFFSNTRRNLNKPIAENADFGALAGVKFGC